MDIKEINTDNPQSFQMETVKAITLLQEQIANLTDLVKEMRAELHRSNETFVTTVNHTRDIQDCYKMVDDSRKDADRKIAELSLELKDRIVVGDQIHADLKKIGKAKAILWSAVTLVFTFLVMYVIEDLTKG